MYFPMKKNADCMTSLGMPPLTEVWEATQSIPFTTAALGGEINVDTLYGTVRCKVPAGSQSGSKLRLKNKGIVSMKNLHSYGDEYVILQIDVPKNLSEREKALLKELQEIRI